MCWARVKIGAWWPGSAVHPAIEQAATLSEDALPKALAPLQDSCGALCDAAALQDHVAQLASRLAPYAV